MGKETKRWREGNQERERRGEKKVRVPMPGPRDQCNHYTLHTRAHKSKMFRKLKPKVVFETSVL